MPESPSIGNMESDTEIRGSYSAGKMPSTTAPTVLLDRIRRIKYSLDDFAPARGTTSHDKSSPLPNEPRDTIAEEVIEIQRVNVYVTNY
jgi:hypothetical protein